MKRTTRATGRTKSIGKDKYGHDVYEKTFDRPIGRDTASQPTKKVRVIRKDGKIWTSYPI